MSERAQQIGRSAAVLVAVWIVVYWWWTPSRPVPAIALGTPAPSAEPPTPATSASSTPSEQSLAPAPQRPDPARSQVAPSAPRFRDYIIRKGDTFSRIAAEQLGGAKFESAIAAANPLVDPLRLQIGQSIRLPIDPEPLASPDPREIEYEIRSDDSLWKIAKRLYGDGSLSDLIYQANRDRLSSPDDLTVGEMLRIPPPPAR